MGIIYMATNTVNGKQYIGQTKMTLDARRRVHQARGNTSPFGLAIKKYGKSSFRWDVLHTGILDPDELDRLEYEEIRKRKTIAPHGYNIREGGNGTPIGVYGANARNAKEVICIETGIRYRSIKEAQRFIGNNNVLLVVSNPHRTAGGYHWVRSVETAAEAV